MRSSVEIQNAATYCEPRNRDVYCGRSCASKHVAAMRAEKAPLPALHSQIRLPLDGKVSNHHAHVRRKYGALETLTCKGCAVRFTQSHRAQLYHDMDCAVRAARRARRMRIGSESLVRRARRHGVDVARVNRVALFESDGYCCFYCGRITDQPCADHYIPSVAGGPHIQWNLVTACDSCNMIKGDAVLYLIPAFVCRVGLSDREQMHAAFERAKAWAAADRGSAARSAMGRRAFKFRSRYETPTLWAFAPVVIEGTASPGGTS